MKKFLSVAVAAATLLAAPAAFADAFLEVVPTGWRLQNYVPNMLVAYFTTSSCTANQVITFPSNATQDDRNRFYAMVLSAQTTGKKVGVYYETVSGSCQITSFYTVP